MHMERATRASVAHASLRRVAENKQKKQKTYIADLKVPKRGILTISNSASSMDILTKRVKRDLHDVDCE
eukprot:6065738-Pleurochrysis_carterae.AAC.3